MLFAIKNIIIGCDTIVYSPSYYHGGNLHICGSLGNNTDLIKVP